MHDVLIIGDINPDLMMIDYGRLPGPGEEVMVPQYRLALGGGCAICASGLAKLGLDVSVYGALGDDEFGSLMLNELHKAGVHTEHISVLQEKSTGISISLTTAHDRSFITYQGTNALVDVEAIPDEVIKTAQHIHVLCYAPNKHDAYLAFFKRIKKLGRTVSFDLGFDETGEWSSRIFDIVRVVDIFMPNEKEALNYTGAENAEAALRCFGEVGNTVVVKLGHRGSLGFMNGDYGHAEPFPAKAVDTTGAGDSFNAGFIFSWLKKYDLVTSLSVANAVGAFSVEHYGGNTGFPKLEELRVFLNRREVKL